MGVCETREYVLAFDYDQEGLILLFFFPRLSVDLFVCVHACRLARIQYIPVCMHSHLLTAMQTATKADSADNECFWSALGGFLLGGQTICLLSSSKLKKRRPSVLAAVLSKPASLRPLKNSPYVKTRSLGLKVHMESGGGAPGENVLRGIF